MTLDKLLEEQNQIKRLVFINTIDDETEYVIVVPWEPGMICTCGKGTIVPRTAINSVKDTGKSLRCGQKTLKLVEIEFSEEKEMTFEQLVMAMQAARAAGFRQGRNAAKRNAPNRNARSLRGTVDPVLIGDGPPDAGGGSGGVDDGDGSGDGGETLFDCMANCLSYFNAQAQGLSPAAAAALRARAVATCLRACTEVQG